MNGLVAYESRLEMTILLQLDFNKTIQQVVSQPFVLHYQANKRIYRHTPDFLAIYDNGAAEIINVKPRRFIQVERNRRAFTVCQKAAVEMGWAYSTRCEIDSIYLRNLKWLSGYRRVPVGFSKYGPQLLRITNTSISIDDAIDVIEELPTIIRPILFHLLWSGDIQADLYSRLTGKTLIATKPTGGKPCH